MHGKLIEIKGTWREVANAANVTINAGDKDKELSSRWKRNILLAEHSPIRLMKVKFRWYELQYWVSVHLVRHKIGIEHFVRTERPDTLKLSYDRNELKQGALIEHEVEVNFQSVINISRKRLCGRASKETFEAWKCLLESIKDIEPELYSVCVRECIYRRWCPEIKSCGYYGTHEYFDEYKLYRI